MKTFAEILRSEIQKPLPGIEVQWQMASSDRMVKDFPRIPGPDAREAGVLILLYPYNGSVFTVFIQRPDYIGVHGGQISFPGGKKELADLNIIETALRESKEEVGVDSSEIRVIGRLTPLFIPVSNTLVTPVAGWIDKRPEFNHQAEEVVFLIEGEIKRFLDPSIVKTKPFEIKGEMIDIKYFNYNGHVIWGATAMILNELLAIISQANINLDTFPCNQCGI
jgi:8-oxo-dGTP pyrophosphatase MutT (NUDIX family)